MAVFTLILEFDGGTHIAQFQASSPEAATMKYAQHLGGIKEPSTSLMRRRLTPRLLSEVPVAIEGVRGAWCCSTSVGDRLALLNIVATA